MPNDGACCKPIFMKSYMHRVVWSQSRFSCSGSRVFRGLCIATSTSASLGARKFDVSLDCLTSADMHENVWGHNFWTKRLYATKWVSFCIIFHSESIGIIIDGFWALLFFTIFPIYFLYKSCAIFAHFATWTSTLPTRGPYPSKMVRAS